MKSALFALLLTGCLSCDLRERTKLRNASLATVEVLARVPLGTSQGSGAVVYSAGGWSMVLTCAHVVNGSDMIEVVPLRDNKEDFYPAIVERIDEKRDLALLLVNRELGGGSLHIATKAPGLYETLTVAGNPNSTRGVIFHSLLTSYWFSFRGQPHWALTMGVFYPGLSGGPVLNSDNELVGVLSNVDNDSQRDVMVQGLGYCVPLDVVKAFVSGLIN